MPLSHTPQETPQPQRRCEYCAKPLPPQASKSRLYCCTRCRRLYQDRRRRVERAKASAARRSVVPMTDPWTRPDLWDTARTLALSMLDPVPGLRPRAEEPHRPVSSGAAMDTPPRRTQNASWNERWLRLTS